MNKSKINFWMISTVVLGFLFLLALTVGFFYLKGQERPTRDDTSTVNPAEPALFTGTLKSGAQIGSSKSYCAEGLYLVSDQGSFITGKETVLLLRVKSSTDKTVTEMYSDDSYLGQKVEVFGTYPSQESFCEALTCDCEDYITVDSVQTLNAPE